MLHSMALNQFRVHKTQFNIKKEVTMIVPFYVGTVLKSERQRLKKKMLHGMINSCPELFQPPVVRS